MAWSVARHEEPSGVGFEAFYASSGRAGAAIVVIAGVHGDEPEAVAAARRLVAEPLPLRRGSVCCVPVANEGAAAVRSRVSPADEVDLARSFPGDSAASTTLRLAALLQRRVLRGADLLVDLHTAGDAYRMPFFVGCHLEPSELWPRSLEAALAFGAPLVWVHPGMAPGRTVSAAAQVGAASIYCEGGGGSSFSEQLVGDYVRGVSNVLACVGVVDAGPQIGHHPTVSLVSGDGDLDAAAVRAPISGRLEPIVRPGEVIAASQPVAQLRDGRRLEFVEAGNSGLVMFLRGSGQIGAGTVVATIASPTVKEVPRATAAVDDALTRLSSPLA